MVQLTFRAMGSTILVLVESADPAAEQALRQVPAWFATWEAALSRFQVKSELMQLNRQAGKGWVTVSHVLWDVLDVALEAAQATNGLVTPTLLAHLMEAGYDRDFASLSVDRPSPGTDGWPLHNHPSAHKATAWRLIERNPAIPAVALPAGMLLDLGGFAKGWAARQAVQRLTEYGPTLVDAGGDIAVSGPCRDGSPWPIAVADPREPGKELALVLLAKGGLATSGRDYRRWRKGADVLHHIIDPRTGKPATSDLLSVTVAAPTLEKAEAAAKAALILGSEAGLAWLETQPELAALLVPETNQAIQTTTWSAVCWKESVL
ncbi:FAD:protein FMN transferase [Candidatus Chloroploca sp. Khr17]|uniref:FAD:protein FMN transferase n=1 Tax=Candidatus Chloroploca sp. Khr17 TaxID=2496869 RepID=UPI00101D4132|nr:FAD:protein FMN transferase [Candidatus Chloroploca sp. Khr17]